MHIFHFEALKMSTISFDVFFVKIDLYNFAEVLLLWATEREWIFARHVCWVSLHIRQPWNANLQLHSAVCKIYRLVPLRKCYHSKITYLPSDLEMGSELAKYKSFVFALVTRFFADHNHWRDYFLFWLITELQWKWSKVLKRVIMNHRFLQKLKNYEENV